MGPRSREHQPSGQQQSHARTLACGIVAALAGAQPACYESIGDVDGAFYNGDGRVVHCGISLDTSANNRIESIDSGLDRAVERGEVIELYGHSPGITMPLDKLAYVLEGARDRGLAFVTYGDFARGSYTAPGIALSFDDTDVRTWVATRPLFQAYGARVTFFVSRYDQFTPDGRAGLKTLAADGHEIEAHTIMHFRAPEYVENHGLSAYLRDEVDPSIALLRSDGFPVNAFAYPFGARTGELDDAIAKRVPVLRAVAFTFSLVQDPCPR